MKRTKRKEKQDIDYNHDQFIERRIVIGLITDSDYTEKVLHLKDINPAQLLGAKEAKRMASWCIDYYQQYQRSPGNDIEGIFMEQSKSMNNEEAKDIADILSGLSDEYEERGSHTYLFDQTVKHFQFQQAKLLKDNLNEALEQNDMDEYYKLLSSFKPFQIESDEKTTFKGIEIFNIEIKPKKWLVEDLLPKGLTIFGGQSKLGKSYLTLNIGIHLAQGKFMFADQSTIAYKGSRGPVLYLALEDPKERLKSRVNAIEPNPNEKLLNRNFTIAREWDKLYRGGLANLEDWLKNSKRPKLIVIDVIAKVWGMKNSTGAGRWYNQEYQIFSPLADLAHKYETSIIAITHTKKSSESDVFNEILGGAGTQGPADNLMVLSRHQGDKNQRKLAIRGKDMADQHLLFEVYEEGAKWECLGEVDETQKTVERQSIVDFLEMSGSMSVNEIKQAASNGEIDVSPNSVPIILRKMVKDGTLIQRKNYGKYSVPGKTNEMIRIKRKSR